MSTTMTNAIDRIEAHARRIAAGEHETVRPGQPFRLNEAASVGDGVWQGDLGLEVVEAPPEGYVKAKKPLTQLVPGETRGARHCLDSTAGVEMWLPKEWPEVTQLGPCFRLSEERTVEHPVHGDVTIAAGHTILCSFQREYDHEQRRERRNAD